MKKSVNTGNYSAGIFLAAVLLLWQMAVPFFSIPKWILPTPIDIIKAMVDSFQILLPHIRVTVGEALLGFSIAIVGAVVLALLMDSVSWVKKALYPVLITSQTIPIISVAPLFIIWFGYGILPKVIVVGLVCFFPIVISLLDGLARADEQLIDLMKTMGASRWQILKIIKLPGAMPAFFSGLKIASTYSVMGAVIGEWLGAAKGLGVFMTRAQHSFMLDRVFAAILVVTALSLGIFGIVKMLERFAMPWQYINENVSNKKEGEIQLKKLAGILLVLALALFITSGCGAKQPITPEAKKQELVKVTVVLDWVPNTNHTGMYVAKDKGYYKEVGLDVEIIQPTAGGTAQLIASGQGEFGVSYQEEVTNARAADIPIKSIAAIIQHNTSGFAAPTSKNIKSPKDFEGKKYGGWGSPIEQAMIKSLMDKYGADVTKVEQVNIGTADFFTSVEKDVDFAWIYYGWTGIEAELRNFPLDMIMLKDEDAALDFYTPVLIASEKTIQENPELVRKFITATRKGYEFAIVNADESADLLLKQVPELDVNLVKASQRWLAGKYQDDAPIWGVQKKEVWENYANWMFDRGLLQKQINAEEAFTNEFLNN